MTHGARFHFTKVLVTDPELQLAFYSSVLGMAEKYRFGDGGGNDAREEIIMASAGGGDPTLVLLHYVNQPRPTPGEAVLGFSVPDVDEAVRRAVRAGGSVAQPPKDVAGFKIKVAFVLDPEGHRLELVQPT